MALTQVSRGLLSTSIVDNGNATAITIDSSERVLIGTDSGDGFNAASTLRLQNEALTNYIQMKGTTTSTLGLLFGDTDDDFVGGFQYSNTDNALVITTNNSERMRIDSSGNVGINTTSGADKLNVYQASGGTICTLESAGTAGAYALQFKNPNGTVGSVAISGTTTTYNTSSDQRLKENIADADDAGSKVDAIQVRKFDWIADGSHQDYGMIAQELQSVAPEAVSAPEDPDEMMGVDYSKLVPMLVKEIQSLRARVQQLENN
jgi:hypothetical protein